MNRMHYPLFIKLALTWAYSFRYPLIFIGAILEGPIIMIATGFFLRFGSFSLLPLYAALVCGDLVADIAWYYVGYYFATPLIKKHGRFFGINKEVFEKVETTMHKYPRRILLTSKLTLGLGFALAVILAAGATRLPMKVFITMNALGELFYVASLLAVGYFFGKLYTSIADSFKIFFAIGGALLITALAFGFSRYLKERLA